ncbi:TetR/AcrR family transcriptional regulator [Streptomyces sp. NPDC054794]
MATTRPGDERRRAILERAMQLATVEGLEGISLGGLATALGMTKSGVQSLFGTKQDLQLAIVATAREGFETKVLRPAQRADDGLPRLRALLGGWIDYLDAVEGGCFFFTVATEFDGREGPVRDAIADLALQGFDALRRQIGLACRLGELDPGTDVEQLLFDLHAVVLQANYARSLLEYPDAYDRARHAIRERLDRARSAAVPPRS